MKIHFLYCYSAKYENRERDMRHETSQNMREREREIFCGQNYTAKIIDYK